MISFVGGQREAAASVPSIITPEVTAATACFKRSGAPATTKTRPSSSTPAPVASNAVRRAQDGSQTQRLFPAPALGKTVEQTAAVGVTRTDRVHSVGHAAGGNRDFLAFGPNRRSLFPVGDDQSLDEIGDFVGGQKRGALNEFKLISRGGQIRGLAD